MPTSAERVLFFCDHQGRFTAIQVSGPRATADEMDGGLELDGSGWEDLLHRPVSTDPGFYVFEGTAAASGEYTGEVRPAYWQEVQEAVSTHFLQGTVEPAGEGGRPSLGQVGFNAYGETGRPQPWHTFDGRPMPQWPALAGEPGAETRRRWEVGAAAIVRSYCDRAGLPFLLHVDGTVEKVAELGPKVAAIRTAALAYQATRGRVTSDHRHDQVVQDVLAAALALMEAPAEPETLRRPTAAAFEALPPVGGEPLFYILSLSHTKASDGVLNWWGPDGQDYTFRLEQAGKYPESYFTPDPRRDQDWGPREGNRAVPVALVELLWKRADEVRGQGMDFWRDGHQHVVSIDHLNALREPHRAAGKTGAR